jgi:hypothetical protein
MSMIFQFGGNGFMREISADGFLISTGVGAGVCVAVPDEKGGVAAGESVVYRRGFAWHYFINGPIPREHRQVDRMVFTDEQRDDVCVFIDGSRVGKGKKVRLDVDSDRRQPFIRVAGRTVAVYVDGEWRRVTRAGAFANAGVVSIGPVDMHEHSWERAVKPGVRFRASGLSERQLALV